MASNLLQAALVYADLGYPVLPCAPNEKRPLTEHGLLDATTDAEQIESWWTCWPDANIAIRTDGLIAVDIDDPESDWPGDQEKLANLDNAPASITPRGGRHIIYRQPEGRGWRNTEKTLASGVDTRADGGYILVAPSIVIGKRYQWLNELDAPPAELPEPPAWLTERLDTIAQASVTTSIGDGNPIPDGQRNATLARLAGVMRRVGMSHAELQAALHQINVDRCSPPLPEREVDRVAANIARYEPDQFATAAAEDHYAQDRASATNPDDPGPLPEHLLDVPGFINDVIKHNLETASRPQPILALAGAISLQAILAARKVRDDRGNRTNLYLVSIAESGHGKEHARKINRRILFEAGLESLEANDEIASDAGLVTAVEQSPASLFQIDEFGRFLRTIGDPKKAPHLYNVLTVLMKLYSTADSVFRGKAYANAKQNKSIDQPCVCMHNTSVPAHFYESLTVASLSDGFVARLIVMEAGALPERVRAIERPVPPSIVDTARAWGEFSPGGNLRREHPEPLLIEATPDAIVVFDDLAARVDDELANGDDRVHSLWARVEEKACRLALVYACSVVGDQISKGELPVIDRAAAEWACELSAYTTRRVIHLASLWISEGRFDAQQKKVLRLIADAGGEISRTDLCRQTRRLTIRERADILSNLVETGAITEIATPTAGRTKETYVLR